MSVSSLDDVVALLMQHDSTDPAGLADVRDHLRAVAAIDAIPSAARDSITQAAACLDGIVLRTTPDAELSLVAANRLIERAMRAMSDSADESVPAGAAAALPRPAGRRSDAPDAAAPGEGIPADADLDLLRDFIAESGECLTGAEAALLTLEANPEEPEAINTVFRAFHTIKGTAAFLGLTRVAEFAHHAESLLSRVRDREIAYTSACADLALRSSDMLKALLAAVATALSGDGVIMTPDGYGAVLRLLVELETGVGDAPAGLAAGASPTPAAARGEEVVGADELFAVAPTLPAPPEPMEAPGAPARASRVAKSENGSDLSVRVRTDRLDRLIDMVGELVIAQSMISGDPTMAEGGRYDLARKVTHAGKIVRELQDLSMSMRMVPLKATFQKLARLVRDVAQRAGKQVEFVTDGEDTEIDRNMVDVIGDPLVHMVRNAVDHGVEPPDAREAAGKPRTGVVRLAAYHAGGSVVVELTDDGRGLDREKILAKAIEKGLVAPDRVLSDAETLGLIFAPGFSTADQITDISGRGVGMDVVKRNIESLRGRVDISSELGRGSVFSIRLPLTLAITDGMLVRVGAERYIVPTTNIHLSFRPDPSAVSTVAGRREMVLLRGELMPIVRVHRLFAVAGAVENPTEALLMIVGDGDRRAALLVDELLGQQQVVTKTLGAGIGGTRPGISGGAILGDGRVGLILDVAELAALARQSASGGAGTPDRSVA